MASLKLDDGEKKPKDLLDLTNVPICSEPELKKWLEKIPDLKIRLEKVYNEEIEISTDEENVENLKSKCGEYPFLDPIPPTMQDVNLKELGKVNINWRMLTMSRPKSKLEEDLFGRLVQLEKLQYRTVQWEMEKELISKRSGSSSSHYKLIGSGNSQRPQRGGLNRAAVTETRLQTCHECGEELCTGKCKKFKYEDHARTFNPVSMDIFDIPKPNSNVKMPVVKKPITSNEMTQTQELTNDSTETKDSNQPSTSDKEKQLKQEPEKRQEKSSTKSKPKNKQKRSKKSIKQKKLSKKINN